MQIIITGMNQRIFSGDLGSVINASSFAFMLGDFSRITPGIASKEDKPLALK
jgi:hypothetical protein